MKLIDADEFVRNVTAALLPVGGLALKILELIRRVVDLQPAVDAKPVKHGHWVDGVYCSECGSSMPRITMDCHTLDEEDNKICFNCGAKMDEVAEHVEE